MCPSLNCCSLVIFFLSHLIIYFNVSILNTQSININVYKLCNNINLISFKLCYYFILLIFFTGNILFTTRFVYSQYYTHIVFYFTLHKLLLYSMQQCYKCFANTNVQFFMLIKQTKTADLERPSKQMKSQLRE